MGFAIADETRWSAEDLLIYDQQMTIVRGHVRDDWYRKGIDREFGAFDYIIRAQLSGEQFQHQCGAGRGMVLVDEHGDIWPCHRFDGADSDSESGGAWRFGNIFEDGFNHTMHLAFLDKDRWAAYMPECAECSARRICAGGCAPANLTQTGSVYRQHKTQCEAARISLRHAMALHDELLAEQNELLLRKFYGDSYRRPNSFSSPEVASQSTGGS